MPTTLLKTDLSIAHLKHLIVGLSDDDKTLEFYAVVDKPIGDRVSTQITVPVNEAQVDILLRLARK
jgi:hypothetical protein